MTNKNVVLEFLAASQRADGDVLARLVSDSVTWEVVGTLKMCRVYQGREDVFQNLFNEIGTRSVPGTTSIEVSAVHEDAGESVVIVELTEKFELVSGGHYANSVVAIFGVSDGQIAWAREYMDLRPVADGLGLN